MRQNQGYSYGQLDWLSTWADDLRAGLIRDLSGEQIGEIAAPIAVAVAASAALTTAAQAATQGGITMSTLGAGIASNAASKLVAGGLAAALAAGGAAVVSGQLDASAPVAGHMEQISEVEGDARLDLRTETIEIAGLGTVEVAFDDANLDIIEVEASGHGSALIRSETQTSAVIDFALDEEIRTLLVSVVEGEIVTSLKSKSSGAKADAGPGAAVDAEADVQADSATSVGSTDAEGDVAVSTEIGIEIGLGG